MKFTEEYYYFEFVWEGGKPFASEGISESNFRNSNQILHKPEYISSQGFYSYRHIVKRNDTSMTTIVDQYWIDLSKFMQYGGEDRIIEFWIKNVLPHLTRKKRDKIIDNVIN